MRDWQSNYARWSVGEGATMSESEFEGWSVAKESDNSIYLRSPRGEIEVNRAEDDLTGQVWYIDTKLRDRPPLSWKARVSTRAELVTCTLPDLLDNELQ